MSNALQAIRSQLSKLKIPSQHDSVYKDECVVSFDSPFSDGGLYVNLITLLGYGEHYYLLDSKKTNNKLYLYEKWYQIEKKKADSELLDDSQPNKLAIGLEGGFITESQYDLIKEHQLIVILDGNNIERINLPNNDLPEYLLNVIQAIIDHSGMKTKISVNTWEADNQKIVSKYANDLIQLPNSKKISNDPSTWTCELSGDKHNLWLNLSTGYIGGGRKNWDGTGGSGAALSHFEDTGGIYPLCVKLGTITSNGADVWSYAPDEDCLVVDPLLPQHLAHWGIDIMKLEKTDKSFAEMEVELNMTYDWSKILESDDVLESISKPGFVGLHNLGSSCYMNAVLQTLVSIPELQAKYFNSRDNILSTITNEPQNDFTVQFSKIFHALLTNKYLPNESNESNSSLEKFIISPKMFKYLVGKNNSEFSSGNQQDAYEYLLYLLDIINRSERTSLNRLQSNQLTNQLFEFYYIQRLQCLTTKLVKYSKPYSNQNLLNTINLRIPLDKAISIDNDNSELNTKKMKLDNDIKSQLLVPLDVCLSNYFEDEIIEYYNTSINQVTLTNKSIKLQNFPKYLFIKLDRYYTDKDWKQIKIDALVPMPEQLDISMYRDTGIQSNENLMAEESTNNLNIPSVIIPNEDLVNQLSLMGFHENGCRKALIATNNSDIESAMNWIFEHIDDPDFNDPPKSIDNAIISTNHLSEESILMLSSMGYTHDQAKASLLATDNNIERAADWLFSHVDDLDRAVAEILHPSQAPIASHIENPVIDDGEGKYSLLAIISHIGKNTGHGHYVCHIKKEGIWALFNDDKVAVSKSPPLEHGYIYLYQRND